MPVTGKIIVSKRDLTFHGAYRHLVREITGGGIRDITIPPMKFRVIWGTERVMETQNAETLRLNRPRRPDTVSE